MIASLAFVAAALLPGASAPDSLMAPGISRALAEYRAERIRDVRYALALDLQRHRDTAYGTVRVQFERTGDGDAILDFRGPDLTRPRVNGASAEVHYDGAHIRIAERLLRAGTNTVELTFKSLVAPAGASIIRFHDATDDEDYLYTLLVPSDANALFPSFDQPDLKARVTLTLRTPRHWTALSNGALERADLASDRAATVHRFRESDPISTYLIAFAAGPWVTRSAVVDGRPISMYVRASRAREAETDSLMLINARALEWLEEYTARPFPFQKYDFLLAPAFPFGGMEHPGAVFYSEESLIFREPPTRAQLLAREQLIYHEVAHQWFGDLVTMRWFDDLWLKEGFSTYLAAVMQDALNPEANAWRTFFLRNRPTAYATDASRGTTPVWQELGNLDQAKSNYGPIVYNKAPGILKALNYAVGDTAFRDGLRAYLRNHAYGSATWRDLLTAIGGVSGEPLHAWAESYILRPGMPVITQRVVEGPAGWSLELTQAPAQPLSGTDAWPIRTEVLVQYDTGAARRIPVTLASERVTLEFPGAPPPFVFANAGDHAYALVRPDTASVRWAERYAGDIRDPLQRAMTWSALWDLVRDAQLPPTRFIRSVLRALPEEEDDYLVPFLVGRMSRAASAYVCEAEAAALWPDVERVLAAGAADSSRSYSIRKAQLDAYIDMVRSPQGLARLEAALDSTALYGLPLRAPTRWAIVTTLIARAAPGADARLAAETRTDSTSDGRRRAFVAGAAYADSAAKAQYWDRYFNDPGLNENWATASLGAFNAVEQEALTIRYITPALEALPWIQQNRRIFYLGSWLNSFMAGQRSAEALRRVERFLADDPDLPRDLRQKILQSADELERTVRIRERCTR